MNKTESYIIRIELFHFPNLKKAGPHSSRWLDKLGLSARMGIEVVMRQVFFGAGNYHLVDENFEPLPVSDHYFSISVNWLGYIFY